MKRSAFITRVTEPVSPVDIKLRKKTVKVITSIVAWGRWIIACVLVSPIV